MMTGNKTVFTIAAVAILALANGQVQAELVEVPVPNGSFELIYKPNSRMITADIGDGWTNGVGDDTPMNGDQIAIFWYGMSGTLVDIPGWINAPDWPFVRICWKTASEKKILESSGRLL